MPYRVLILEDDKDIRDNLVTLLEEEGSVTDALPDGSQLLTRLSTGKYDVVICDVMMPGKDGYELLKDVKKSFAAADIPPFIFLTAKSDRYDFRKGMELGADDYISKPYTRMEVLNAIDTQIKKRLKLLRFNVQPNSNNETTTPPSKLGYNESLFIDTDANPRIVKIKDIVYIEVKGDYTTLHTSDKNKCILRRAAAAWQEVLPAEYFLRVNRNVIINIEYITKIEKWFKYAYRVHLKFTGEPFTVSQRCSRALRNYTKQIPD